MASDLDYRVKNLAKTSSVLIIDDDEFTLQIYESIFKNLFLKVFTACDGEEGYELWLNQNKN